VSVISWPAMPGVYGHARLEDSAADRMPAEPSAACAGDPATA
jgi:hypothetical protein